jgi:hypothetical protein
MLVEAQRYSWMTDKLTGQALSTPVDIWNHWWDATRCATEGVAVETALDGDIRRLSYIEVG